MFVANHWTFGWWSSRLAALLSYARYHTPGRVGTQYPHRLLQTHPLREFRSSTCLAPAPFTALQPKLTKVHLPILRQRRRSSPESRQSICAILAGSIFNAGARSSLRNHTSEITTISLEFEGTIELPHTQQNETYTKKVEESSGERDSTLLASPRSYLEQRRKDCVAEERRETRKSVDEKEASRGIDERGRCGTDRH